MNDIFNILNNELQKAIDEGEVPVAALIMKNNKIVSFSHNNVIKYNNPIYHAEVLAIEKAAKKMKCWNLNDCVLYTTLEPCSMCKEVIKASRIKKVYYILDSEKIINDTVKYYKMSLSYSQISNIKSILKAFFKSRR